MGSYLHLGDKSFDCKDDSNIALKLIEESCMELPNLINFKVRKNSYKINRKAIALICFKIREIAVNDEWINNYTLENMDDYIPEIHGDKSKFFETQLEGFKDSLKRVSDMFFYTLCSMEIYDKEKIKAYWI